MSREIDVVIIGAGSAGLFAAREVKKFTKNFVLIDPGPFGTTCARTACMPSKILIQVANDYHRRKVFERQGILGGERLEVNTKLVLKHVRSMRDHFVESVLKSVEKYRDHLVVERAEFLSATSLKAGNQEFTAKHIIIATGSVPAQEPHWLELEPYLLTSETIFELEDLPKKIAVIGMGAVGAELGQAMSRLGVDITGFHRGLTSSGVSDPVIHEEALRIFSAEFPIHLNTEVKIRRAAHSLAIDSKMGSLTVDNVLASIGRRPRLENLGLENTGAKLDARGVPFYDSSTMKVEGLPIFIAGDANGDRAVLPEASDEGRIAGYNSVRPIHCFQRRIPLNITFTDPNIARVGATFSSLKQNEIAIGEVNFSDQGRATIGHENLGILRIYGDRINGRLLGAEMICPGAEHFVHLLSLAIQKQLSVFELLFIPFYHPVLEQGLRTALRDLAQKVEQKASEFEMVFCESTSMGLD